ncbi:MAG: hypothetical protein FWD82_08705, partial [Defluviitaleaceae bacterium]|nr:hypothetical protein [Defluviitaleaceae bacterium]
QSGEASPSSFPAENRSKTAFAKRKCQGGAKPLEIASPLTRGRNDVLILYFLISKHLYCDERRDEVI